jgi:hypothetical protein
MLKHSFLPKTKCLSAQWQKGMIKTKPLSHLPKQALCVNWHHVNILTVAGLHRAHPSTSLDRQITFYN